MESDNSSTLANFTPGQINPSALQIPPSMVINQSKTTGTGMALAALGHGAKSAIRKFDQYLKGKEYKIKSEHLPIFENLKKNYLEAFKAKALPHFWETDPEDSSKLIHIVSRDAIIERYTN